MDYLLTKGVVAVADYLSAIGWASQTVLRDVIGKTMLSDMREVREKLIMGLGQEMAKKEVVAEKTGEPVE